MDWRRPIQSFALSLCQYVSLICIYCGVFEQIMLKLTLLTLSKTLKKDLNLGITSVYAYLDMR